MDHLNLLQISSPADGLIYLNGTLAGELLGGELSLCIPRGRFCLSFSPLGQEEGKVFLPFSRILDLSQPEPAIVQDDGVLCVYLLGEVCCVQLTPPYASVPSLPYLIAARSLRSNGPPLRAQLYFDRVLCFSLEENGRILFAAPLPFEAESGSISAVWLGGELYALAELIGKDKKALACLAVQAKKLLFCEPCLSYKVSKEELELFCPAGECGCQIRKRFSKDLLHPEISLVRREGEKADPARAFSAAIACRDAKAALSFLSPALARELSFQDLLEFFGDSFPAPDQFVRPGELACCEKLSEHIFAVRRFALDMRDGKIDNISEL